MNDIVNQVRVEQTVEPSAGPVVLQVLPALDEGGAERGTVDLARYLIGHGWRALIASSGGAAQSELEAIGARCIRLPLHSKNPFTIRTNIRRLQRLIREHRVELVHARSRAPAWSAYSAARRCKVPFLTTFHGVYRANSASLFGICSDRIRGYGSASGGISRSAGMSSRAGWRRCWAGRCAWSLAGRNR
jgi:hypothetical protein